MFFLNFVILELILLKLYPFSSLKDTQNKLKNIKLQSKIPKLEVCKYLTVPLKKIALFENTHEKLFCHSFY